jgi:hypothetical protein
MKRVDKLIQKYHLDRRRKYFVWDFGPDKTICCDGKVTLACPGCSDDREHHICEQGAGCSWCGHTGKSVTHFPVPIVTVKGDYWFDKKAESRYKNYREKVRE